MNRRGFFRVLATAVVAAPAIPALLEAAAAAPPLRGSIGAWSGMVWREHEAARLLKTWYAESFDRDLFAAFSGEGPGDVIQIQRLRYLPQAREFAA